MQPTPTQVRPRRDNVLAALRSRETSLRASGIAALYMFGSAARDEATPESDVDLFLDQASPETFDLLDLLAARERIAATLGNVEIDLATRGSLHPALREAIERSAIRVF